MRREGNKNIFEPEIHEALYDVLLFEKWFYKVAYSGRGAMKSYSFADAALARMLDQRITITVCRELDTTILDSVHKLIKERIDYHGLSSIIKETREGFKCVNGSKINYKHFRNNTKEIKGLQKSTICWIFEGENVTKESMAVLVPTISRNPNAEIWIEFNPDSEDDYIYNRFIINPPDNAKVVKMCYLDNPFCEPEFLKIANDLKKEDPDEYNHVYLGEPAKVGSRIYPMFSREANVRAFDLEQFKDTANFFMGQDPATSYYPACVWIARIPKGENEFFYYIYNEFPTMPMMGNKYFHEVRKEKVCSLTLKTRANLFRVMDNTIDKTYNWVEIVARGIDTRFVKASGAESTTLNTSGLIHTMAEPENGGMVFETPPESMIDVQRDRIRSLLEYNKDMGIVAGLNEPHLFVAPHCYNVIDAFLYHRFNSKDKAEYEKRKDMIDAVRICFATMQQHEHRLRSKKESFSIPEKNNVEKLVDIWMKQ